MGAEKHTVPVDIRRLSTGLRTTFYGVSEIFRAIGADEGAEMVKEATGDIPADQSSVSQEQKTVEKTETPKVQESPAQKPAEAMQDNGDTKTEQAGTEVQNDTPQTQYSTSLTMQDIIKIVTKKIETDRKNSAKIGEIVKSFGISKLTELPEDKYEAFLTQISGL